MELYALLNVALAVRFNSDSLSVQPGILPGGGGLLNRQLFNTYSIVFTN